MKINIDDSSMTKTPNVYFPTSYFDVTKMAEALINDIPIIINLTIVDYKTKLRIIDFICGVAYVTHAKRTLLEKSIYLFSPVKKSIR